MQASDNRTPDRSGVVLLGSRARGSPVRPVEEHLATFAGGMFGLGSQLLRRPADLHMAIELTESSYWAYRSTATGLMPEISTHAL
jgi:mannosyl-oligosaccharide alpha-1,2-mannosidase